MGFNPIMSSTIGGIVSYTNMTIHRNIDQLANVHKALSETPNSRRIIMHAWDPRVLPDETISPEANVDLGNQALPPCHMTYQMFVRDGKLSLSLYIRSSDRLVGLPYNIAQSAAMVHMFAATHGLEVGELIIPIGDSHVYKNHLDAWDIMSKQPIREELPTFKVKTKREFVWDYTINDFEVEGYIPGPKLYFPVAK
jgi:thymidylate synthase